MSGHAETLTNVLSLATLFAHITIFLGAIILTLVILKYPSKTLHHLSQKIAEQAILSGFFISLVGLFLSLVYSVALGFEPCDLCWWQRIFLYPQVIIFGVAFYNQKFKKTEDEMIFLYSLILSLCGGAVALFQYYGQLFNPSILNTCASQGVSCAKILFVSFGYITMPMMSLTAYIILILFFFFRRRHRRNI